MRRMATSSVQAAELTRDAVPLLRAMGPKHEAQRLHEVISDRGEAEPHDQGLKDLFNAPSPQRSDGLYRPARSSMPLEKVVDGLRTPPSRQRHRIEHSLGGETRCMTFFRDCRLVLVLWPVDFLTPSYPQLHSHDRFDPRAARNTPCSGRLLQLHRLHVFWLHVAAPGLRHQCCGDHRRLCHLRRAQWAPSPGIF